MSAAPPLGTFLRANARALAAGMLIAFTSSYGQTFFVSLFADDVMREYGLSDGGWGALYAAATILSAGAMIFAGSLTDRLRVRVLAAWVCAGLAGACLLMAGAGHWTLLVLAVFALRFTGQGMMSHLSAVAMARWFTRGRGRALAIAACGFALGQAVLPVAFVAAEPTFGWRALWVVAAVLALLAAVPILALLRFERTPAEAAAASEAAGLDGVHWTRAALLRAPLFWLLVPLLLGPPAFGTALFFHQVHLAGAKGWALVDYVALLPLFTATTIAAMLGSGWLIDRFGAVSIVRVYLLPFIVGFALMAWATTLPHAALALAVFGLGVGAQGTLVTALWAELYGTRHLGAIKALAAAIMVLGSALGPGLTGALIDLGWDFPAQMPGIALYMLAAQALAALALNGVRGRLPRASEIDVVGA
ncbi:MFS transporter [Jannaschia sp. W003]|uniref:MFS transporter n=1 Tax=Jannaschia sp. W003 TaxID=2867012 RepID=UPI0021A30AC4|nr:MFS transporter [Jannaschia sp. W003]UWQ21979.1 MFS transporter [Jannaschia sp. W003]